jgi:hypothetical protein
MNYSSKMVPTRKMFIAGTKGTMRKERAAKICVCGYGYGEEVTVTAAEEEEGGGVLTL